MHSSPTNGVAERAVRRVKEGTAALLLQSGLSEDWWKQAIQCFCFLRNIVDKLPDDNVTAYERRFGVKFDGPILPFGCEVTFQPSYKGDIARLHKYGSKVLSGIFMGYSQQAGGTWSGDLLIADWEELEKADHVSEITMKRFKAKEVHSVKLVDFVFPVSAGRMKQPSQRTSRPEQSRRMALGPSCAM